MTIPTSKITEYNHYLSSENKPPAVIKEHIRYANRFANFVGNRRLTLQLLSEYRIYINERYNTHNSKNSCVGYINIFLRYLGKKELQLAYFESSRMEIKLKSPILTDSDISKILSYAYNC